MNVRNAAEKAQNWHLSNFRSPSPYLTITLFVVAILGITGLSLSQFAGLSASAKNLLFQISIGALILTAILGVALVSLYFIQNLCARKEALKTPNTTEETKKSRPEIERAEFTVFQINLGTIKDFLVKPCGVGLSKEIDTLEDKIFKLDLLKLKVNQAYDEIPREDRQKFIEAHNKEINALENQRQLAMADMKELEKKIFTEKAKAVYEDLKRENALEKSPFKDFIEDTIENRRMVCFDLHRLGIEAEFSKDLFKQAFAKKLSDIQTCFSKLGSPDIMCFQECYLPAGFLKQLFPGYEVATEKQKIEENSWNSASDTVILWKADKFSCQGHFVPHSRKSVVVLLQETTTQAVVQVASAHLDGFNLKLYKESPIGNVNDGDSQLLQIRDTLYGHRFQAHMNVIGMDSNTTEEIYGARFDCLTKDLKYKKDESNKQPTIVDANLKTPAQIDFIFAEPSNGYKVEFEAIPLPKCFGLEVPNIDYFSDHLGVFEKIRLIKV